MKEFLNILKFFCLFYLTAVLLLITYSLSFYISDIINILKTPLKISFIFLYSAFLSMYFALHVLYNVKKCRVVCFFSVLFALFYLHEIPRNMFLNNLEYSEMAILLFILYLVAGVAAIFLAIIANLFQFIFAIKNSGKNPCKNRLKQEKKEETIHADEQYFV